MVSIDDVGKAGATPAAKKGEFSLELVTSNSVPFWPLFRLAVAAPPGHGKTHLIASASAAYPNVWPPPSPVTVDDVLVVETDENGLAPFREAGVNISNVIDLSGATSEDYYKLVAKLPKFLAEKTSANPAIRFVAIDHASGFFESIFFHIQKKSQKDGPKVYNDLAQEGKDFLRDLKEKVRVPILFNFHLRKPAMHLEMMAGGAVVEMHNKAAAAAGGLGRDQLDYALGGKQLADVVRNSMTLSAALIKTDLPGGKCLRELAFEHSEVYTKRRLTLCVGEKEPANIGSLFDRIAAKVSQPWR